MNALTALLITHTVNIVSTILTTSWKAMQYVNDDVKVYAACPQGREGMSNFINVKLAIPFQASSILIE